MSKKPLADWTDYRCGGYWDDQTQLSTTFIRDHHNPDTAREVRAAWDAMKAHVEGVNALQRVGFQINREVLAAVKWRQENYGDVVATDRKRAIKSHLTLFVEDMATADYLADGPFYVPANCDWRGRVYRIPNFRFDRNYRVRSLFLFARGERIGNDDGLHWLKVHVANRGDFGGVSKKPFHQRIEWVNSNLDLIKATAEQPQATADWWWKADKPFSFLAGCLELAAAIKNGTGGFVTHLPISFDASCSGAQHFCGMTSADEGWLVNLTESKVPQDLYEAIADRVRDRIIAQLDPKWSHIWVAPFAIDRALLKKIVIAYLYGQGEAGTTMQLSEKVKEEVIKKADRYPDEKFYKSLASPCQICVWTFVLPSRRSCRRRKTL